MLLFLVVVINSYSGYLDQQLKRTKKIAFNKHKIIKQVREIDALAASLEKEFDLDTARTNPDTVIFNALDELKTRFPDSTIKISGSGSVDGFGSHRVDIEAPVRDYSMLVEYFRYLESFRLPEYKISAFSLSKGGAGEMVLTINGSFLMPAL